MVRHHHDGVSPYMASSSGEPPGQGASEQEKSILFSFLHALQREAGQQLVQPILNAQQSSVQQQPRRVAASAATTQNRAQHPLPSSVSQVVPKPAFDGLSSAALASSATPTAAASSGPSYSAADFHISGAHGDTFDLELAHLCPFFGDAEPLFPADDPQTSSVMTGAKPERRVAPSSTSNHLPKLDEAKPGLLLLGDTSTLDEHPRKRSKTETSSSAQADTGKQSMQLPSHQQFQSVAATSSRPSSAASHTSSTQPGSSKKSLNKQAADRYRRKKREQAEHLQATCTQLERDNLDLTARNSRLEDETKYLRSLLVAAVKSSVNPMAAILRLPEEYATPEMLPDGLSKLMSSEGIPDKDKIMAALASHSTESEINRQMEARLAKLEESVTQKASTPTNKKRYNPADETPSTPS